MQEIFPSSMFKARRLWECQNQKLHLNSCVQWLLVGMNQFNPLEHVFNIYTVLLKPVYSLKAKYLQLWFSYVTFNKGIVMINIYN